MSVVEASAQVLSCSLSLSDSVSQSIKWEQGGVAFDWECVMPGCPAHMPGAFRFPTKEGHTPCDAQEAPRVLLPHPATGNTEHSPSPTQTELPDCLQHHTKSQATGQKTQLFSAVTLLNLIFPTSSWSRCSRMKCVLGLCHKTLHFVKTIIRRR